MMNYSAVLPFSSCDRKYHLVSMVSHRMARAGVSRLRAICSRAALANSDGPGSLGTMARRPRGEGLGQEQERAHSSDNKHRPATHDGKVKSKRQRSKSRTQKEKLLTFSL